MKSQETDNRVRPRFAVLLAFALAAVSSAVWMSMSKPEPAPKAGVTAAAAKHTAHSKRKAGTGPAAAAPAATEPAQAVPTGPAVAASTEPDIPIPPPPAGSPSAFEAQWGIRVSDVVQTDIDSVLEMRYMVVDPAKTATLADEGNTPYLIEQASGAKVMLCVPLHELWPYAGHSRARSMAHVTRGSGSFPPPLGKLVKGRTYSLLVANPDLAVKKGGLVVVAVGDIRSDALAVQ